MLATFYDHILAIAEQEGIAADQAMQMVRKLGILWLEISANNAQGKEKALQSQLAVNGLGVSSLCAYFDFGRTDSAQDAGKRMLDIALRIGAKRMLVIPGFFGEHDNAEAKEMQYQRMALQINQLAETAKGCGVSLIMEAYDHELSPCSTTLGLNRFLSDIPLLSCAFDTGNFIYSSESAVDAYKILKGKISHVHLKDRYFHEPESGGEVKIAVNGKKLYPAPVGGGELPIADLIFALKRDDYRGIYTIEHYGAANQLDYLSRSVKWVNAQLTVAESDE